MSNQVPSTNSSQGSSRAPALLPNSTPSLNANTPLPVAPGVQASAAASAASLPAMVSSVAAAISGSSPSVSVSISNPSVQPNAVSAAPSAPLSLDDRLRQLLSQSAERQRAAQAALRSGNSTPGSAPGIPSSSPSANPSAPGSNAPASASLYQQLLAIAEVSRPNRSAAAPANSASAAAPARSPLSLDAASSAGSQQKASIHAAVGPASASAGNGSLLLPISEHPNDATLSPGIATNWTKIQSTQNDGGVNVNKWERIRDGFRERYYEFHKNPNGWGVCCSGSSRSADAEIIYTRTPMNQKLISLSANLLQGFSLSLSPILPATNLLSREEHPVSANISPGIATDWNDNQLREIPQQPSDSIFQEIRFVHRLTRIKNGCEETYHETGHRRIYTDGTIVENFGYYIDQTLNNTSSTDIKSSSTDEKKS